MCGRFWASLTWEEYRALLDLKGPAPPSNFAPNWNAAPTHQVLIARRAEAARALEPMRWGLVPPWAKEYPKFATFNAKSETLDEKATWKSSLNKMRCAVPISGFYEWRGPRGNKTPYAVKRRDGQPMLLAGLWAYNDKIEPEGLRSFAIVTCPANKAMSAIHDRMPVILEKSDLDLWLGAEPWGPGPRALLKPAPDDALTAYPVSRDVGSVKNNRPDLIAPVGDPLF